MAFGFIAVANAEVIYSSIKTTTNKGTNMKGYIMANNTEDGTVVTTFGTSGKINPDYYPLGLALYGNDLYASAFWRDDSGILDSKRIKKYNATTGAFVSDVYTSTDPTTAVRGLCTDNVGNLYASLDNGYIAKFFADGSPSNLTWANARIFDYATNAYDMEIRGGYLYAAMWGNQTPGAGLNVSRVIKINLSNPAEASLVTQTGYRVDGLTFDASGRLWTTNEATGEVGYWDATFTTFTNMKTLTNPVDIDYFEGCLYVASKNMSSPYGRVSKGVMGGLDGLTITWTDNFITSGNSSYTAGAAIVIVPEPGTLALLAAGIVGLLAYAWRKRK
jgi:hypothetical protein